MKFPFYYQPDHMDCAPTCLRMVAKFYGRSISLEKLRRLSETTREGTSMINMSNTAEKIGFRTLGAKIDFKNFKNTAHLPSIVFWQNHHFIVVYKIKKGYVYVADPAHGLLKYKVDEFIENWIGLGADINSKEGIILLLEPTPRLYNKKKSDEEKRKNFSFLYQYLFQYKKYVFQLLIGLLAGSILQLIFPFLTQSVVDIGIQNQDLTFIYIILIAQLFLFLGRMSVEVIRAWILLHMSTRINISLISDFFIKLMNLPIAYFDVKMTGDLMQRIDDHQRIKNLLTTQSLSVLFSLFNLFVFGGVLAWYDLKIFGIFLIGSLLYFIWVIIFLKKRKDLDYKRFSQMSDEQSKVMELINGMQEIKLHNAEKQKRWSWEHLQARLFKISMKSLALEQTQSIGSNLINEVKNIFISIFAATLVIEGEITLGMMMSISYITGQLNSPIQQIIGFVHSVQDAKIALERLSEIHSRQDEELNNEDQIKIIPSSADFEIDSVDFRYTGSSEEVLKGLSLSIPSNKITAIVGASGSGKTTLMKVLLKFYEPNSGSIRFGNSKLNNISQRVWRDKCGVVMQEGYFFNDTIANNIAIGQNIINQEKLIKAAEIANLRKFIDALPLGFNTKIGMEGVGMSTGQKQRLLIARAVYKNPDIIFFDEATSALDSTNERIIMENLNVFFKDRTAIIIAHRLSTVKNADQIVVLDQV